MVGSILPTRRGGPGSIPGGVRNFNYILVLGACPVFSLILSGRGALVYLSSVLVPSLLLMGGSSGDVSENPVT